MATEKIDETKVEPHAKTAASRLDIRTRPGWTVATLIFLDLLMISASVVAAIYGRWFLGGHYDPSAYLRLWPCLGLFIGLFAGSQLYSGVPIPPAEELRRLAKAMTLVFLSLGAATFLIRGAFEYSRSVLIVSWLLSIALVWAGRGAAKMWLAPRPWWGRAVVVLGATEMAENVIRVLQTQPGMGLKPVAVVSQFLHDSGQVSGVPVISGLHRSRGLAREYNLKYAILAMPDLESRQLQPLLQKLSRAFVHLIYVPRLTGFSSLWVTALDLGGVLGLEVRHRLLDPGKQMVKRLLDLVFILMTVPLLVPVIGLIVLAVKIDSRGPVFYGHKRLGRCGTRFRAWKFRTMVADASRVLEETLESDPALRQEWALHHKLRDDPRITRVGRWLRKTSLDELPQLWNVVCGQMSLVGPRPIIDEEVKKYGEVYSLMTKVAPGMTGMWQVSGRNNVSYEQRVRLDAYYVRNWSVWLDLYLLGRTVLVVLCGDGAY